MIIPVAGSASSARMVDDWMRKAGLGAGGYHTVESAFGQCGQAHRVALAGGKAQGEAARGRAEGRAKD